MDKRIRKAASRAISSRTVSSQTNSIREKYRKRNRWLWGLSTAAVLVLSFTVVLNLLMTDPDSPEFYFEEQLEQQGRGKIRKVRNLYPYSNFILTCLKKSQQ